MRCNSAANYIRHDKQAEFLIDGSIEKLVCASDPAGRTVASCSTVRRLSATTARCQRYSSKQVGRIDDCVMTLTVV
jgi:hypothetical protein